MDKPNRKFLRQLKVVRALIFVFIAALVVIGVTAFPIQAELAFAKQLLASQKWDNDFTKWIETVYQAVCETNLKYPFIAYGTDWLAFAHIVIAIFFMRPLLKPLRDAWVIDYGLLTCAAIFPLALVAGHVRGIPFFWQLIDCSFGLFGGVLLLICRQQIKKLRLLQGQLLSN